MTDDQINSMAMELNNRIDNLTRRLTRVDEYYQNEIDRLERRLSKLEQ